MVLNFQSKKTRDAAARDMNCIAFSGKTFALPQDMLIRNITFEGAADKLAFCVVLHYINTPFQFLLMWEIYFIIPNI